MGQKIAPPDNPKEFAGLLPKTFFESQLAKGMDRQELWTHVCDMWDWAVDPNKGKSRPRTERGWVQFARNWIQDKAVSSSQRMDVIKDIGEKRSGTQAILVRVSASCPKLNVEQLKLVARFLSGLNETQQNECFESVLTDNLPHQVKPVHFQQAAVAIRNRQANSIVKIESRQHRSNDFFDKAGKSVHELMNEMMRKK